MEAPEVMKVLIAVTMIVAFSSWAHAETFGFTASEFQSRLDKALLADGGDTTKSCKKSQTDFTCQFNDVNFQKSVSAFKGLNLANGHFSLKEKMTISTENGKVSTIIIGGDRGDPINTFHTIGQIGGVFKALNPKISDDNVQRLFKELGLLRGDSDETIGSVKEAIEDFAEIRCNNQRSDKSTAFGCAFLPRY
jgi:hypothetical protein